MKYILTEIIYKESEEFHTHILWNTKNLDDNIARL